MLRHDYSIRHHEVDTYPYLTMNELEFQSCPEATSYKEVLGNERFRGMCERRMKTSVRVSRNRPYILSVRNRAKLP